MRKRIHVINCCRPLLWYRVRPSEMVRVFLLSMLFAGFLGTACGQGNTDNGRLPAAEIPVHILTKDDVGRTVVVESGDWLEFELPLAVGAAVWRPRVEDGLGKLLVPTPVAMPSAALVDQLIYLVVNVAQEGSKVDRMAPTRCLLHTGGVDQVIRRDQCWENLLGMFPADMV